MIHPSPSPLPRPVAGPRRRRRWHVLALAAALLGAGCTNLRYYTTYRYKHVRTEQEKTPLKEAEYLAGLFRDGRGWFLRVMEVRRCEQKVVDVSEEVARITITSPTWYYFLGLGALQASVSAPFWILGARSPSAREARNNYLVGSLVFLVPGLAIMGIGAYLKLVSGTEDRALGQRRRVKSTTEVDCGVAPAKDRQVTLGTRTGHLRLGRTDAAGRLQFPVDTARPLVRWEGGRAVKTYFEVSVEDAPAQEVRLPKGFPLRGVDLKEPTLRPRPEPSAPSRPAPRSARPAPQPVRPAP